ncbi:MAG: carbon starvation protein A [Pseudomonadota bacterium]
MLIIALLVVSIILFALAYRFYSPKIATWLGMEPNRPTPAHVMKDGVDYCPAKLPILFGHHFASIAGAAPIVGPVIAAAYGWGPVILWIILGGIFLGSVHDFAALIASLHHRGRSIGEVISEQVGRLGGRLFLFFLWATLVLLIAVYLVIVAKTFETVPSAATASSLFVFLAVFFGLSVYRLCLPLGWASLIAVIILAACMFIGWLWPIELSADTWLIILIAYIITASVTPVWILLQPRDYLNSFLLYSLLIIAIVGVFVARPEANFPMFITWYDPKLGSLFPILFVTVACGAISGYHSVVASGTTAKQLDKEAHARPIGYGAMLVECVLATLALISVIIITKSQYSVALAKEAPVALFSNGMGTLISSLGINQMHGTNFAALAVSAFVLTTLDTATRLCRYAFQEFFAPNKGEKPNILNRSRFIGTFVTVAAAAALAFSGHWKAIWPIFGSANQLLAALAFLAVALWLKHKGKKVKFLLIPMCIMFVITLSALGVLVQKNIMEGDYVLATIATALFVLAITLLFDAIKSLRKIVKVQ